MSKERIVIEGTGNLIAEVDDTDGIENKKIAMFTEVKGVGDPGVTRKFIASHKEVCTVAKIILEKQVNIGG